MRLRSSTPFSSSAAESGRARRRRRRRRRGGERTGPWTSDGNWDVGFDAAGGNDDDDIGGDSRGVEATRGFVVASASRDYSHRTSTRRRRRRGRGRGSSSRVCLALSGGGESGRSLSLSLFWRGHGKGRRGIGDGGGGDATPVPSPTASTEEVDARADSDADGAGAGDGAEPRSTTPEEESSKEERPPPSPDSSSSMLDKLIGETFSLFVGCVALLQTMGTILTRDDNALLDELASRLLSEETARAVKTIRRILSRFSDDHGIVDVLSLYPARAVASSVLALSRLQRALAIASGAVRRVDDGGIVNYDGVDGEGSAEGTLAPRRSTSDDEGKMAGDDDNATAIDDVDPDLLSDLARYAVFANAAYGWKGGLALSGKLHMGDRKALLTKTGIDERDVVAAHWKSRTHRPAYFIVRDVERRKIVLCIRGTLSARDVLTDLCCTAEDFLASDDDGDDDTNDDPSDVPANETSVLTTFRSGFRYKKHRRARAHHGMLASARGVSRAARKSVASELAARPDYDLVVIGHSLGAGTAAVLGTIWRDTFPGLIVYAYGCPCVSPDDAYPTLDYDSITSIVGEGDPFSCLSLGHLADASAAIAELCEDEGLRDEILRRTATTTPKNGKKKIEDDASSAAENLIWCRRAMERLRERMTGEKLYPPGRILRMGGATFGDGGGVTLREVPTSEFRDLTFHPRMLDLSRHIPNRYEAALRSLWSERVGAGGSR